MRGRLPNITAPLGLPKPELFTPKIFKASTCVEEALRYAEHQFKIKECKIGGENEAHELAILNWINEGLTNIFNITKGKVIMPDNIFPYETKAIACVQTQMQQGKLVSSMGFAPDLYMRMDKKIIQQAKTQGFMEDKKQRKICQSLLKDNPNFEKFLKLYEKFKQSPQNMDLKSKLTLYYQACEVRDELSLLSNSPFHWLKQILPFRKQITMKNNTPFDTIYHEVGHIQHAHSCPTLWDYYQTNVDTKNSPFVEDSFLVSEFINSKTKQKIASMVSAYARKSPGEFVAEIYSYLMTGNTMPDEVMKLYRLYDGPTVTF